MSPYLVDTPFAALLWIGLKASAIVAVAVLLQALWRRRTSAATRHLTWVAVVASLLLLPLAWQVAPQWSIVVATAPTAPASPAPLDPAASPALRVDDAIPAAAADNTVATTAARSDAIVPDTPRVSFAVAALAVYVIGFTAILMSLTLHHWRTRRFAARSAEISDDSWTELLSACAREAGVRRPVRLLRSREAAMPMTFGTRAPAIVVPATADLWPEDRRRAVLLHELAHVARYDCLTQTLAIAACAAYWPHPAVWWVARRLRIERELACDDRVLAAGAEPRAYAGHLLEIAYSLDRRSAPALAVSMARPSQLEGRLLAALDAARNRRSPGPRMRLMLGFGAAIALVALAGATPTMSETVNTGQIVTTDAPVALASSPTAAMAGAPQAAPAPAPAPARTKHELKETTWAPMVAARRLVEAVTASVSEMVQDNLPGTWELRPTTTPGTVHLRLVEENNSHGTNVPLASLEGLTEAQVAGRGGPVQFRVTRDAGTLQFEGVLRNGVGAGTFSFTPNPAFPAELAKRGFTKPTAREQYQLARHDIGFAFLDELNRQGYAKPDTAGLVTAGQHGVNTTYLREMGALGYSLGSLPPLITLRDHGVDPNYVRGMAEEGYKQLPADKLRQARDHGVDPRYVKGMREAGYASLPIDEVINARDHGVDPKYVRALADGGYRNLPLDQVIRVRDHGVDPDYVNGMRQLGYTLSIEALVNARDHGVDLNYVRGMAALGYDRLPIERLIKARDHGVSPDYAKEMKALGYDNLALDDLIVLRDHGVTPDRVRSANSRAGTKLPIDLLRSLADGGGLR
jgi:beta-lactamase regulating signal transducer with metallopeptidase domain